MKSDAPGLNQPGWRRCRAGHFGVFDCRQRAGRDVVQPGADVVFDLQLELGAGRIRKPVDPSEVFKPDIVELSHIPVAQPSGHAAIGNQPRPDDLLHYNERTCLSRELRAEPRAMKCSKTRSNCR